MQQHTTSTDGAATGGVRLVLRLEGLAVLLLASGAFFVSGGNGWLFAALFFAPDLSFAGYAVNPRIGAGAYNSVHSYVLAAILVAAGWLASAALVWQLGLILAAHIGFDRAWGYGLKYAAAFGYTHLGRIGRDRTKTELAPEP